MLYFPRHGEQCISPTWRAMYFTVMLSDVFHRHGERSVAILHHAIDGTLTAGSCNTSGLPRRKLLAVTYFEEHIY